MVVKLVTGSDREGISMRQAVWKAWIAVLLLAVCGPANAQEIASERERFRVVTVARELENPWGLAFLPDGRMLVTERPGNLRIVARDGKISAPLKGVPKVQASGQGGLLDVLLDAEFANNATLYLSYAEPGEGGAGTAVARAKFSEGGLSDVKVIFRQSPKVGGGLHFGSRIVQARDGKLFITMGERYQRDRAQDLGVHLGKVVRINPDGSVPPDNPFVGRQGALPEIWSYGHRNSQGAALNPATGAFWMHEHGAQGGDEINIPEPGKNYGWPVITHGIDYNGAPIGEGKAKAGMEPPRYFWVPSIAPSGMAFYTGDAFPKWKGNLFVGSLKFGRLVRLELDGMKVTHEERLLKEVGARVRDVRMGLDGLLYVLTDESGGRLLRLEPVK
jgi:glucose/arabinose dehydrogenase